MSYLEEEIHFLPLISAYNYAGWQQNIDRAIDRPILFFVLQLSRSPPNLAVTVLLAGDRYKQDDCVTNGRIFIKPSHIIKNKIADQNK
jgi:hypothetical protein